MTVLVVNVVYLWMIGALFQTLVPLFGTEDDVGSRSAASVSASRSPRRPSSRCCTRPAMRPTAAAGAPC